MKNLLSAAQMRKADAYTIEHRGISSTELMEQAAKGFVKVLKKAYPNKGSLISILCGQGDNGGDGLAIARLLHEDKYKNISVYLINFGTKNSKDYAENLEKLVQTEVQCEIITEVEQFENIEADLIIDSIIGSGLNKPIGGKYTRLASIVNGLGKPIIAVDVPTGFPSEGLIEKVYNGIKADLVICFERPKLNFFFPESAVALNRFKVISIGLDKRFLAAQESDWKLCSKLIIKPRKTFTHKGTYGHALIVAGNINTMGAGLLTAEACLHAGAGLTTLCLPESGLISLNSLLPEVMALPRSEHLVKEDFVKFTAIAIGPGLGLEVENENLLALLIALKKPMVLDADALTILASNSGFLDTLPKLTILTPHLKEFDRLFGQHQTWWQRLETAKKQAKDRGLIIVLKNQYTFVCLPSGEVHINQTGNPGMASGGMGDVLTGIIVSFLAQSYSSVDAATLAVYMHGKAGDELAKKSFTVRASQVAKQIPKTLKNYEMKKLIR